MITASPPALIDELLRRSTSSSGPGRERALGVVGRFWTLGGERVTLDADGFAAFDRPGYAKVVWDFRLTSGGGHHATLDGNAHSLRPDPPGAPARRGPRGYSMSGTLALA